VLNWLYSAITKVVLAIHGLLSPVFGANSGWSWGLSIVLLTVMMRLLLFPLFVRQIRTQRAMQLLQPEIEALKKKYKNDKEALNQETMRLYRERGANPLTGCLPLLLQLPVFFALFHSLDAIKPTIGPDGTATFKAAYGYSQEQVYSAAHAKIFGAPIAAAFNSSASLIRALDANPTTVKVVAVIMIVLMGASTFWTQRQLMARTAKSGQQTGFASQQKVLLYILPFSFAIFGFRFPIGVLLYWLTTNLWSMGQQHFVIAKMDLYGAGGEPKPRKTTLTTAADKPVIEATVAESAATEDSVDAGTNDADSPGATNGKSTPKGNPPNQGQRRPGGSQPRRKRRGGR
jgi:YidC/Oxa1 family membrane protein insertase